MLTLILWLLAVILIADVLALTAAVLRRRRYRRRPVREVRVIGEHIRLVAAHRRRGGWR